MTKQFEIGKIVNTQGIKGDVRVVATTDDIQRFKLIKAVTCTNKNDAKKLEIESVRFHKQFVLLKFKGIDDMTSAEKLKNYIVKIEESEALPLEDDEYYIRDLYDMEVITTDGEKLGIIKDIIFTGANDVYVVKTEDKDVLIPAIKQCIKNVNVKENVMTIELLNGLI